MKLSMSFFKLLSVCILMISSLANAQSVGGGLGGDRSKFLSSPKPVVINQLKLTCDQLTEKIKEFGKVRLNFASDKASVYSIVYSVNTVNCASVRDKQAIAVETLDTNRCWAGYVCETAGW